MMKHLSWLTGLLGGGLALSLMMGVGQVGERPFALAQEGVEAPDTSPFEVALMGDMPTERSVIEFMELQQQVNRSDAAFAVHVGDIKASGEVCSDELILSRKEIFEQFEMPFVLLPGDNDWTDCDLEGTGEFDPVERLQFFRDEFTEGDLSLAVPTLQLERQSNDPQFRAYRENVRWTYNNVLFTALHVVGSGNNFEQNPTEYSARNRANLAWLADSFEMARAQELAGVMVIIHANPLFEEIPGTELRQGFDEFIAALNTEVSTYELPVVLVHGDTHQFQRNNPLLLAVNNPNFDPAQLGDTMTVDPETGELIVSEEEAERLDSRTRLAEIGNFSRLEVFGSPTIAWVRAIIDPESSTVFNFRMEFGDRPSPR